VDDDRLTPPSRIPTVNLDDGESINQMWLRGD
jgi:hypothetical protein